MKRKKLILLTFTVMSIFLISYNILQEKVIAASKFESLPKNIEIGNYNVDITESTLYENYLFTTYTVETLDKSNINESSINLDAIITSNIKYQEKSNNVILKQYNISNHKIEITLLSFISIPLDNSIKLKYSLHDAESNEIKNFNIYDNYKLQKDTDLENRYYNISDSITVDNIDIVIDNLLFKSNQGILCFSSNDEIFNPQDYIIKLKSGEFEDIFLINSTDINNTYYVPMIYNEVIDFNDIEIHLINTYSNNKTLIYDNSCF